MMERYLRQSALVDQDILGRAKVLVVGIGGLGNFVATELVLAGVGEVHVVDPDVVELHNLNRQFLFTEEDVGIEKAKIAEERLKELNPHIRIKGIVGDWKEVDVNEYDMVFDCLDRWEEKKALMRKRKGILVVGSVGEDAGMVAVLNSKRIQKDRIRQTNAQKVLGARVGVVGSLMAAEGIRILSGEKTPLEDKALFIDFGTLSFYVVEV